MVSLSMLKCVLCNKIVLKSVISLWFVSKVISFCPLVGRRMCAGLISFTCSLEIMTPLSFALVVLHCAPSTMHSAVPGTDITIHLSEARKEKRNVTQCLGLETCEKWDSVVLGPVRVLREFRRIVVLCQSSIHVGGRNTK